MINSFSVSYNILNSLFCNSIDNLYTATATAGNYLVAGLLPEDFDWKGYKEGKKQKNISKEKIIKKFRNCPIYAEVLIEITNAQPICITTLSKELGYDRGWVSDVSNWLENAKLVYHIVSTNNVPSECDKKEFHNQVRRKVIKKCSNKNLRGAANTMIRKSKYFCLTIKGEMMLQNAIESIGGVSDGKITKLDNITEQGEKK
jgi:hypothetical protein